MFAARLICSWIGALGLAAGAFCQTCPACAAADQRRRLTHNR
jgi:hypothetical protein